MTTEGKWLCGSPPGPTLTSPGTMHTHTLKLDTLPFVGGRVCVCARVTVRLGVRASVCLLESRTTERCTACVHVEDTCT